MGLFSGLLSPENAIWTVKPPPPFNLPQFWVISAVMEGGGEEMEASFFILFWHDPSGKKKAVTLLIINAYFKKKKVWFNSFEGGSKYVLLRI